MLMNHRAVALLAERLPNGLVHPGDPNSNQPAKVIPLPGLSNLGMPPGMAEHFAEEAGFTNDAPKMIAEAIVNALESGGFAIVAQAELEQQRAGLATPADANPAAPSVAVYCACNRKEPIFSVSVGRAMVVTSGKALRARLDEVCTC